MEKNEKDVSKNEKENTVPVEDATTIYEYDMRCIREQEAARAKWMTQLPIKHGPEGGMKE